MSFCSPVRRTARLPGRFVPRPSRSRPEEAPAGSRRLTGRDARETRQIRPAVAGCPSASAHGSGSIPGTFLAHTRTLCRRRVHVWKTSVPSSLIVMRPMLVVPYPMRDVQWRDDAVAARTMKSCHSGCPVFYSKSGPLLRRRFKRGSRFLDGSRVAGSRYRCLAVPTTAREFSSFVAIGRRFLRRSLARKLLP